MFDIQANILYLNPIFKWYKKDFDSYGGVKIFIMKYLKVNPELLRKASIRYLKYDWSINSQNYQKNTYYLSV